MYTAQLLWSCPRLPAWEIETAHPGFEDPVDAARFANRLTPNSPDLLVVAAGSVVIETTSRTRISVAHVTDDEGDEPPTSARDAGLFDVTYTAWRATAGLSAAAVVWDDDFEQLPRDELLAATTDEELLWTLVAFDIVGPDGSVGVDVRADDSGDVTVVLTDDGDDDDARDEAGPPLLLDLP